MTRISICVPTWECNGYSEVFTRELFQSIKKQSFDDYEVCISDQSDNNIVLETCEEYANYFSIRYFKNTEKNGGPANTNSAMDMAEGEIIKVMFQDDLFYSRDCLKEISEAFDSTDKKWLVSGCNHINESFSTGHYNYMIPKWNDDVIRGVNTISSPSVLSVKSEIKDRFDSNVPHLMDCEYYYTLYSQYGEPIIVENCHITNRMHENQHSHIYRDDENYQNNFNSEVDYCLNKHNLV
jgi:glycosyltransferase involved in cell wall biosynthesis